MKVELKEILDQLTEALNFDDNTKVSALIDSDTSRIVGWARVKVDEDGTITMVNKDEKFDSIKQMLQFYY
jgi:hypothetical protein